MDRRDFLKVLGITVTAPVAVDAFLSGEVQLPAYPQKKDFNPQHEYGMAVPCSPEFTKKEWDFIVKILAKDAARILPRGTRFELRCKVPGDFGRAHGVAWYSLPAEFAKRPFWKRFVVASYKDAKIVKLGGYLLAGRGVI